jgi:hypothetical protein
MDANQEKIIAQTDANLEKTDGNFDASPEKAEAWLKNMKAH